MKKWLWGDNSINIQGRIMVLGFCPFPHCHLSINQVQIPRVVLKLCAQQGTEGWTDDYMLPPLESKIKYWVHLRWFHTCGRNSSTSPIMKKVGRNTLQGIQVLSIKL